MDVANSGTQSIDRRLTPSLMESSIPTHNNVQFKKGLSKPQERGNRPAYHPPNSYHPQPLGQRGRGGSKNRGRGQPRGHPVPSYRQDDPRGP